MAAEEGKGIVHRAPGCGEEDFELGRRHGLAVLAPADEEGRYRGGFGPLEGRAVAESAAEIAARLRRRGSRAQGQHRHRYPTCWRCGEELILRGVDEGFIRADEVRPRALTANAAVTWLPEHMGRRMHDWLANMGDWCISRKRYWGVPLPFYPCVGCGRSTVVGGVAELRALAVDPAAVDALKELHRPWIDAVALRCPGCRRPESRVAEVGDCWLDAGVVPFSTLPYLEDRAAWARWFPADLVVEMAAQIRGWFYALLSCPSPWRTARVPRRARPRPRARRGRPRDAQELGQRGVARRGGGPHGAGRRPYLFTAHPMADPIRFGEGAARGSPRASSPSGTCSACSSPTRTSTGPSWPGRRRAPQRRGARGLGPVARARDHPRGPRRARRL